MQNKHKKQLLQIAAAVGAICSSSAFALPVDWHGTFGVDSTIIDNYRRLGQDKSSSAAGKNGSQEVKYLDGSRQDLSFQSYILKLNPNIIINDSATFKAEISTGYNNGGNLGTDLSQSSDDSFGNALYQLSTTKASNESSLRFNKFYMNLYSDTATYKIGRHSADWGLGAIVNNGPDRWDRYETVRDGITVDVKLGSFEISPYWARTGTGNSFAKNTAPTEYGVSFLYNNSDRDLEFGVLYNKKKSSVTPSTITTNTNSQVSESSSSDYKLGETNIKMIDVYMSKSYQKFKFAVEFPFISGDMTNLFNDGKSAKYKTKAILAESSYKLSNKWTLGLSAGLIDGDDGNKSEFNAMFLNPNYQIANIMFRYNLNALSDNSQSLYDSFITNSQYLKLNALYEIDKWSINTSFIYAAAKEVAKGNNTIAYDHQKNKSYTSKVKQSKDLGYELDLDVNYKWNNEINIGGSAGYHFVGDYYSFTNDSSIKNSVKDTYVLQIKSSLRF